MARARFHQVSPIWPMSSGCGSLKKPFKVIRPFGDQFEKTWDGDQDFSPNLGRLVVMHRPSWIVTKYQHLDLIHTISRGNQLLPVKSSNSIMMFI